MSRPRHSGSMALQLQSSHILISHGRNTIVVLNQQKSWVQKRHRSIWVVLCLQKTSPLKKTLWLTRDHRGSRGEVSQIFLRFVVEKAKFRPAGNDQTEAPYWAGFWLTVVAGDRQASVATWAAMATWVASNDLWYDVVHRTKTSVKPLWYHWKGPYQLIKQTTSEILPTISRYSIVPVWKIILDLWKFCWSPGRSPNGLPRHCNETSPP